MIQFLNSFTRVLVYVDAYAIVLVEPDAYAPDVSRLTLANGIVVSVVSSAKGVFEKVHDARLSYPKR